MMDDASRNFDRSIGDRVRSLRARRGLTLTELAQRSGVSRAMISRIERADASPTAALLARICEALGETLSAFFADEDVPASALSRRAGQRLWRDPHTGYLRRSISPAGMGSRVDVVEVEFPPGARVAFPPRGESKVMTQHVWLFEGELQMTVGEMLHRLLPGDCLFMDLGDAFEFHNPGKTAARYAVILDQGH
ncbi:XRE family transcriptional regulator [Pseudorhizobium endolithicum]|uniref:XRE family transcriptional regulator n=2 Tax=Pseudorhizobium endolithicum TaxID=1191678 RepID=A0ABN7K1D6_9HYPH|nr:XRE family transcriptional regulator [Pseudorhizobium endolithicum]